MQKGDERMKRFSAANCITVLRMAGTLVLLALRPLSPAFYAVYTAAGLTDALDGWVARRTGTCSALGARLDSCADLLFYGVSIVKLLPALVQLLPGTVWWAVIAVACLRIAAYLTAAIRYRTFASLHTWLNKLTGAAVFLIPYLLSCPLAVGYCRGVCAVAGIAALEELAIHLCKPTYEADTRSILRICRPKNF